MINQYQQQQTACLANANGCEQIFFAMGCFWGVERFFSQLTGVAATSVGYAAGQTLNPTYQQVCQGITGHAEVIEILYQPSQISLQDLLKHFWQQHDPTQGMRQGNDIGSQYRSMILTTRREQQQLALQTKAIYQAQLDLAGAGRITTEIIAASQYYLAEEYHQQYLRKNPGGYCQLRGTGVRYPE